AETARALQIELEEPFGRSQTARGLIQIFRQARQGGAVQRRVSNEAATNVERRMQPLVRVERQRISHLEARHQGAVAGRELDQGADTAIHMEPEVLLCRQGGQSREIVDRSRVDGPCTGDDAGGLQAGRAIFRYGGPKNPKIQAEVIVAGDGPQSLASQSQNLHCLAVAAMELV